MDLARIRGKLRSKPRHWAEQVRRKQRVRSALEAAHAAGLHRPPLLCLPDRPEPHSTVPFFAAGLGMEVTTDPGVARSAVMFYENRTTREPAGALRAISEGEAVINIGCVDISKSTVAREAESAFGYAVAVDPETGVGPAVEKPEQNAAHAGRVVDLPTSRRPGYTYERVVNNVYGDEIEDLRVGVIAGAVRYVVVKRRPLATRFSNVNTSARLGHLDLLTDEEPHALASMFGAMGVDFGEADCLRDREDGRLYVVDVNSTPWGPTIELPEADKATLLRVGAAALALLLVS